MHQDTYNKAFEMHGPDFSKMCYRAFVLYSCNYEFARSTFPEFEPFWLEEGEEWLKTATLNTEEYYKELVKLYSKTQP